MSVLAGTSGGPAVGPSSPPSGAGPAASAAASGASPPTIGLNLRVTGYCNQGGRKYMEDVFSVAYQQTEDEKDLEYAFFGIFDGHGGREAAIFAKEHLMDFIVRQKSFWGSDDESVLRAIHEGFVQTHQAMWKELESWPKTASGLPSTAGTTASIAFIRRGKIYVGHVGDSAIVLGVRPEGSNLSASWIPVPLTRDHKPESVEESTRITQSGGKVVCKSGVPRVVWNRPRMGHKGPVRRSTQIDEIPFLAVARSLGDLWSYNSDDDVFVVSPEPDTFVYPIDITRHRCLILGTDGMLNMLSSQQSVRIVCDAEKSNEQHMLNPTNERQWINPSKRLVDSAIARWNGNNLRADNTSVVTVMLDPPGPPRAQVLKRQRELAQLNSCCSLDSATAPSNRGSVALVTNTTPAEEQQSSSSARPHPPAPVSSSSSSSSAAAAKSTAPGSSSSSSSALSIISRLPNSSDPAAARGHNLTETISSTSPVGTGVNSRVLHDFQHSRLNDPTSVVDSTTNACNNRGPGSRKKNRDNRRRHRSPTPPPLAPTVSSPASSEDIQCNGISSSDDDSSPAKPDGKGQKRQTRSQEPPRQQHPSRELSALRLDSPAVLRSGGRRDRGSPGKSAAGRHPKSKGDAAETPTAKAVETPRKMPGGAVTKVRSKAAALTPRKQLRSAKSSSLLKAEVRVVAERIRGLDRRVAKRADHLCAEVDSLKADVVRATRPKSKEEAGRCLRPRKEEASETPMRKRKRSESAVVLPAKSPKVSSPSPRVVRAAVVATRSKQARVLRLKK